MVRLKHLSFLVLVGICAATDWQSFRRQYENVKSLDLKGSRIIGGDEVVPHSYPFTVGLVINGKSFCGGTLVSENYVMTAAHCAIAISTVEIILGAHNVTEDEPTQVRPNMDSVVVHEDFDKKTFQNDIALIKLESPVVLTDEIQLAKLPAKADENTTYYAADTVAVGWGLVGDTPGSPNINDMSDVLRAANITILDVYSCGDYYNDENVKYVTELNLCTSGHKNKGTCNGDSGGDLLFEGTQIGIVSSGSNLCEMCYPSIYTNVGKFLNWIEDNSDVVLS